MDYSKNIVNEETMKLLFDLVRERAGRAVVHVCVYSHRTRYLLYSVIACVSV